ncbi:MAG: hypothetical protein WC004_03020 [Candidatus Absconditabacterales bacterium]
MEKRRADYLIKSPEEKARGITLHEAGKPEIISQHGGVALVERTFVVSAHDIAQLLGEQKDTKGKPKNNIANLALLKGNLGNTKKT